LLKIGKPYMFNVLAVQYNKRFTFFSFLVPSGSANIFELNEEEKGKFMIFEKMKKEYKQAITVEGD